MEFKNRISGEELSHADFVSYVWKETERQYNELYLKYVDDVLWCNLTFEEQIALYCEQFEYQLNERDWYAFE